MSILSKFLLICSLIMVSPALFADETAADKLSGYKWQPTLLSSYKPGNAPEIQANIDAFKTLVAAEKAAASTSAEGKYLPDIINGFWFYTTAHSWTRPSETEGRIPPAEGQKLTETSQEIAEMLIDAWKSFSGRINPDLPVLGPSLAATMERLTGKELDAVNK